MNRAARPIAAIDIGSNSVHLTLARVSDGDIEVIERRKDPAQLAGQLERDGRLNDRAVDRVVATLRDFAQVAKAHDAVVRATATAAVRAARNGQSFLDRAEREAGVDVELISGAQEARLTYQGVMHGLPELRDDAVLAVDCGGGSTELVCGREGRAALTASVATGSLVVTRTLLGPDPIPRHRIDRARRRLESTLSHRIRDIERVGFAVAVATGGTAQRLARLAQALDGEVRTNVHRAFLSRLALDTVVRRLARSPTRADRLAIPGMDPERVDTVLGGALVFQVLTRGLGIEGWTVSMDALRTGLLVDTHRREADRAD